MTTVVYLVKHHENNQELRYSLRSLVNLPHDRVVLVGYRPTWVTNVDHVPGNRFTSKWLNVFDNLRLACSAVGGRFVVMNDDIFILEPMERAPSWYRNLLVEHLDGCRGGQWRQSLEATLRHLRSVGIDQPLSYELHTPVEMDAAKLEAVLAPHAAVTNPPQWRTLYGNIHGIAATKHRDTKVRNSMSKWDRTCPVVSTEDCAFGQHPAGKLVRERFAVPGPYDGG